MFNQFAYGIHVYGSERASLEGFHLEGNVSFNNGCVAGRGDDRAPNIHVGGGSPARRIRLVENYTWHSIPATHLRLGYASPNEDVVLQNNLIAGFSDIRLWKSITATGNQFIGADSLVTLELGENTDLTRVQWNNNSVISSRQKHTPLVLRRGSTTLAATWSDWHKAGLDQGGAYREGEPTGVQVFVRPNPYEAGRAHVIVYNWDRQATVEADVSKVLNSGAKYRLLDAQNVYGEPILQGVYEGTPLRIPMQPRRASPPFGRDGFQPPAIGPEFGIFVLASQPP